MRDRLRLHAPVLAMAACLFLGCKDPPIVGAPAASSEPRASASVAVAPVAPPSAAAASSASAGGGETAAGSTFETMFSGPPAPDTRISETATGAGGVHFGLPPKWSTQDVYNAYLIASTTEAKAMVYLVTGADIEPKSLESFASNAAYPIYLKDIAWDTPWTEAKIGPAGYEARVRRGHGTSIFSKTTRRAAIAIGVNVPGRKTIHVLGSWNEPSAEVEAQFAQVMRGIGRCKHKPKRGCVPVAPVGEETEVQDPAKRAPGSSPFG